MKRDARTFGHSQPTLAHNHLLTLGHPKASSRYWVPAWSGQTLVLESCAPSKLTAAQDLNRKGPVAHDGGGTGDRASWPRGEDSRGKAARGRQLADSKIIEFVGNGADAGEFRHSAPALGLARFRSVAVPCGARVGWRNLSMTSRAQWPSKGISRITSGARSRPKIIVV